MKYHSFLLAVFSILYINSLIAQSQISNPTAIFKGEVTSEGYILGDLCENFFYHKQDKQLFFTNRYFQSESIYPPHLDFDKDVIKYNRFTLYRRNISSNIEQKKGSTFLNNLLNNEIAAFPLNIYRSFDSLIVLSSLIKGNIVDKVHNSYLDENLSVVDSFSFMLPDSSIKSILGLKRTIFGDNLLLTYDEETVSSNLPPSTRVFIISDSGDIVKQSVYLDNWLNTFFFRNQGVTELDSTIIAMPNYILDTGLNVKCQWKPKITNTSGAIISLENDDFLWSGTHAYFSNTGTIQNAEYIFRTDQNCNTDTIYNKAFPATSASTIPGALAISMIDTNNILFCTSRKGSILSSVPSDVTLTNIALDGTVNWSIYFNNGDFLAPIQIVPISDEEFYFFIFDIGFSPYQSDVIFAKFNKNGDIVSASTPQVKNMFKKVLVYPNPASEYINIEHSLPLDDLSIELYNSLGQVCILKNIVENKKIEASHLVEGIYFYRILSGNKLLESGQIIKK